MTLPDEQPQITSIEETGFQKKPYKYYLTKLIAIFLVLSPLYQTYAAFNDITKILPTFQFIDPQTANSLKTILIKKAIIISTGLFIDSFYGFTLLIKPFNTIKTIHIVLGIIVGITSQILYHTAALDQVINQINFLPIT